ncbi:hypothetical protein J7E97_23840 [Streptomyces sp. ISL-66]|uniref:hypothetical protein n=1 Tax=Streptomyces sp. ISL-66 TaxID=2819186 RepID=UPI001BE7EE67|nr:hypothetical protein [Streptomyces sp. ISL-66]MBT2470814.1 hypothetical protein [Streptomyces sp. ISL-66]
MDDGDGGGGIDDRGGTDTSAEGGDPACFAHLLCPTCGGLVSERLAPCCARLVGPVRHPWLGVLRPDAEGRLTGGIEIGAAHRRAAADGDTHCVVTIGPDAVGDGAGTGPVGLDDAAARVRRVLEDLDAIEEFALAQAPAHWPSGAGAADAGPPPRERLFLRSIDVIAPDATDVAFACEGPGGPGTRGSLLVRVDASGRAREVRRAP